jgi:hypothetical protein
MDHLESVPSLVGLKGASPRRSPLSIVENTFWQKVGWKMDKGRRSCRYKIFGEEKNEEENDSRDSPKRKKED